MKSRNNAFLAVGMIAYTIFIWKLAFKFNLQDIKNAANGIIDSENSKREKIEKEVEEYCVRKRLEESEMNYKRALIARKELEMEKPLHNKWSWAHGIHIWDFFYATFDCPHSVERVGSSGDGGKWICGFNRLAEKSEPCVVYSFGVGYEISFEEEVLWRTNCSVYMFDHTVNTSHPFFTDFIHEYPAGRVFLQKLGIGPDDTNSTNTLKSFMKANGHDFVDIVKIDIEAAEFPVITSWKRDFPTGELPFGQLAMEIHVDIHKDRDFYATFKNWFENLEVMGLRPFRNEINLLAMRTLPSKQPEVNDYVISYKTFVSRLSRAYLGFRNGDSRGLWTEWLKMR